MPPRPRDLGVGGAVLALLLTGACSSHSGGKPAGAPTSTSSGGTAAATVPALTATVGVVAGRLPSADRTSAAAAVGKVVDAYLDAAYVGGSWPRTDVAHAFPGFTTGAARRARTQAVLLTDQTEGGQITGVTVASKVAAVDLVAAHEKPVGATARFRLVFTTTGGYAHRVRVSGRLLLTPVRGSWRVFGYDVRKAER